MPENKTNRFMSWRDLVITPLVFGATLLGALGCTVALNRIKPLSFLGDCLAYYTFLVVITLFTLKIIRTLFPLEEGVYTTDREPVACYVFNLCGFLYATSLWFLFGADLVPPLVRNVFYRMLGMKFGSGIIVIAGRVQEANLVSMEDNAILGDGALVIPHVMATDALILGKVRIKKGAVVGARSIVMPGVTIGENAMIAAMSLVPMNTNIPDNEIWAGAPAKKVGSRLPTPAPELVRLNPTKRPLRNVVAN